MLKEFKAFAFKGNVVDLAIAVIIGGAFGKIVTSLVNDLVMPVIGIIIGGINFETLSYTINPVIGKGDPISVKYGIFIQSVVDFLIIAVIVFLFTKLIFAFRKKEASVPAAPPAPTREEELLTEIRDLLKENNKKDK